MFKHKENIFASKFRLLNSQENSEEISWSSSESSDYEIISKNDRFCDVTNAESKARGRKRKRKKKILHNISNLNITILETQKEQEISSKFKRSPSMETVKRLLTTSPILKISPKCFPPYKPHRTDLSIFVPKQGISSTSPILTQKHMSPRNPDKIKKNLFNDNEKTSKCSFSKYEMYCGRKSPLLMQQLGKNISNIGHSRQKIGSKKNSGSELKSCEAEGYIKINPKPNFNESDNNKFIQFKEDITTGLSGDRLQGNFDEDFLSNEVKHEEISFNDSISTIKTNCVELAKRVKSYFDSHFSSESPSQISISESQTPKDDRSEEIEITNSLTQISKSNSFGSTKSKIINKTSPAESCETILAVEKSRKIKYKKDGLAYRLNGLLKKQKANISLWQHEKFLAENSNFVIPKEECSIYRIQKLNFQYGCYLLDSVDIYDNRYTILINSLYINNCTLSEYCVLKLYIPFTILVLGKERKLIVNICKFECEPIL